MGLKYLTVLYKIYVLCLPFGRLFVLPFGAFFNKVITQFSTIVMLLGVFYIMCSRISFWNNKRCSLFLRMYIYMFFSSILMATILTITLSNTPESPYSAILGDVVLYFFVVLSIYFNTYCLSHCISIKSIWSIFDWQIIILLIVGYSQLVAIVGFSFPYDVLSSIFALRSLQYLTSLDRGVTFFGAEPAAASIICFITIPYIYSCIHMQKGKKRFYYVFALLLFLLLVLTSNSSQLMIVFLSSALLFVWTCYKPIKKSFYYLSFLVGLFFAIVYLNVDGILMTSNTDTTSLEYMLFGKIVDRSNMSLAMRSSTVINDLKVFMDYPFTGVGDGNQGFFFAENQPLWTTYSLEVSKIISENIIPNGGGNFFASYLSAYGILGVVIFFVFLSRYKRLYKTSFLVEEKRLGFIFRVAMILFLFSGWHTVGIKQVEIIIFILSLPCVAYQDEKNKV